MPQGTSGEMRHGFGVAPREKNRFNRHYFTAMLAFTGVFSIGIMVDWQS